VLRPEDAMARPVQSTLVPSNNVLLKVTVPKRTGRKRKIGSNEPFADAPVSEVTDPTRQTAKDLLRSLSDNPSNYKIEPVGRVERTHVFRGLLMTLVFIRQAHAHLIIGMPDFVYSTTASPFANRFKDQILSFDCESPGQRLVPDSVLTIHSRQNEAIRPRHEQRCSPKYRSYPASLLQPRRCPIPLRVSTSLKAPKSKSLTPPATAKTQP